jgi:hypothetical protein
MSKPRKVRLIALTEWLGDLKWARFKYVDDATGERVDCPKDQSDVILDRSVFEH